MSRDYKSSYKIALGDEEFSGRRESGTRRKVQNIVRVYQKMEAASEQVRFSAVVPSTRIVYRVGGGPVGSSDPIRSACK
jgi:hypothetical protein